MNGLILIDKPAGISSFGVVAKVRWVLSRAAGRKVKVGHTGTLDPFATGLMVVVVGSYCKRAEEFSKLDKSYTAAMHLGKTSSTCDPEGELVSVSNSQPSSQQLQTALQMFTGNIQQTPPIYSAIKINGQRAYKLARKGEVVEIPKRTITVHSLRLVGYNYPLAKIDCNVSSGTYIRTLVEDIGNTLGTGAYTQQLRRTTVGEFDIKNACLLDEVSPDKLIEL